MKELRLTAIACVMAVFIAPPVLRAQQDTIGTPQPAATAAIGTAGQPVATTELLLFIEDQQVVTATRSYLTVAEAPASVTVITGDQLREMGARTLAEALSTVAGIQLTQSDRHHSQIYVRGIPVYGYNDKVLLLVDGVPHREVFYGHVQLDQYLPLDNIKRIEIVKGPGSALYGTNAFAGVIHVITYQPGEIGQASISGLYGTRSTAGLSGLADEACGPFKVMLYGQAYRTDGDGPEFSDQYRRNALQQDPAQNYTVWLKAGAYGFSMDVKTIEYTHKYVPSNSDLPITVWAASTYRNTDSYASLGYQRGFSEKIKASAQLLWQRYDLTNFWQNNYTYDVDTSVSGTDSTFYSHLLIDDDVWALKKTEVRGGQAQLEWELPRRNHLIAGAEVFQERIIDVRDIYYNEAHRDTIAPHADTSISPYNYWCPAMGAMSNSLFCEDIWRGADWANVTVGLRRDYKESYGRETYSPRFGAVLQPRKNVSVKLLYGEAFRSPSYREMYTKQAGALWTLGNPGLRPEKIKTSELGVEWEPLKYVRSRVGFFYSEVNDMIFAERIKKTSGADSCNIYANVPTKMYSSGTEALVKVSYDDITGSANYTYVSSRQGGARTPYIPMHSATYSLGYRPAKGLSFLGKALWVGERIRSADDVNKKGYDPRYPKGLPRPPLAANLTFDASVSLEHRDWEATLAVTNILNTRAYDSNYRLVNYYDNELPGRNLSLKVTYKL